MTQTTPELVAIFIRLYELVANNEEYLPPVIKKGWKDIDVESHRLYLRLLGEHHANRLP